MDLLNPNLNIPEINYELLLVVIVLGIVILVILAFIIYRFINYILEGLKKTAMTEKALDVTLFEVKVPEDDDTQIQAADQMFTGLLGIFKEQKGWLKKRIMPKAFVSFEIVAFKDNIQFYVLCPSDMATIVDRQINGAYPAAEVVETKEYNIFPEDSEVAYATLSQAEKQMVPIRTYEELATDSLATITDAMSKLGPGEAAAYQVVVTPAGSKWRNEAKQYVKDMRKKMGEEGAKMPKDFNEDTLNTIDKKTEKSGFLTDIRLIAVAPNSAVAENHLTNMLSMFDQFTKETGNRFKINKNPSGFVEDFVYRYPREEMLLNTAELASVYHFPNKDMKTPHIQWLLSSEAPAADFVPKEYKPDYMWLGQNIFRGQTKDIFMMPEDRVRHMYVIGQTGAGKTRFIAGQAIRDIKAGRGVTFIDPHGSDVQDILEHVPPERVEDVIYFDPSDTSRPTGLNMLEFRTEEEKTFVSDELINIFDKLYDLKATGGPIFEQYMRYSILLNMEDVESGNTIMEIPKVLADTGYRKYKLSKAKNPEVKHFWEQQAEKAGGEAKLENVVPYITSKLTPFTTNNIVRPIIAQQKSTIDFRWAMDNQKIILVNLAKGRIGEMNAYLLGMIIIGKILAATLSRVDVTDRSTIKDMYLYIDEFQNFLTDSIVTILSEARKYRLSLTMAHQFLGQLTRKGGDTKIRDAVFGNVGTKVVMRVGIEDAKILKEDFEPYFDAADLSRQQNVHAYVKLLVDGKYPPPFTIYTDDSVPFAQRPKEGNKELAETIKKISRLQFGRDRDLIEAEIANKSRFQAEVSEQKDSRGGGLAGLLGGA